MKRNVSLNYMLKNIIEYGTIILIILYSKTAYFGILYEKITFVLMLLFIFLSFIFFKIKKKQIEKNIFSLVILCIFLFMNIYMNFKYMSRSNFTTVILYLICLIASLLVVSIYSKERFSEVYVNILFIICIISLICFGIALFKPEIAYKLLIVRPISDKLYYLSPLYMWGWSKIDTRNAGPFWEPGAFQGFIIIAILMMLTNLKNRNNNNKKFKFIVLIITLLTTQSTTGYILMIIIVISFNKQLIELFESKGKLKKIINKLGIILIIFSSVYIIISSNNISEKFSKIDNSYSSVSIRSNDFYESIDMIKKGGFIGLGKTSVKKELEIIKNIEVNSVGLLNLLYTYGIFFGCTFIILNLKGLNSFFNTKSKIQKISIFIIFIVLHCTEGLYWLITYLLFLYKWRSEM